MIDKSEIHPIIAQAVEFTKTYKEYQNAPIAIREAMCLKAQYPVSLGEIQSEDIFAGRKGKDRITYVGSIWWRDARFMTGPGSGPRFFLRAAL